MLTVVLCPLLPHHCTLLPQGTLVHDLGKGVALAACEAACVANTECGFACHADKTDQRCMLYADCPTPMCNPGGGNWFTTYQYGKYRLAGTTTVCSSIRWQAQQRCAVSHDGHLVDGAVRLGAKAVLNRTRQCGTRGVLLLALFRDRYLD